MDHLNNFVVTNEELPSEFTEFLAAYADDAGELVNSFIPSGSHPDMDRYLYNSLAAYSANGGKRHRPLICFAACLAVDGDIEKAKRAAAAIEYFHTAALIHDDIADEAQVRHGKPCLHLAQGVGLGINTGDFALSLVSGLVVNDPKLDDATKVRVMSELFQMLCYTIEGQALDIGWARDTRYDVTTDDYFCMATHKTAHYSGAIPLAIGAIIGGGTEEEIEALRGYGLDVGLAFQIQDDLLNLVGSKKSTQKGFRDDITEGKRTLVVVHALQNSNQKKRLIEILSSKTTDSEILAEAVCIMEQSGSIDFARSYAENLALAAKERLIEAMSPSKALSLLTSMADWAVSRLK